MSVISGSITLKTASPPFEGGRILKESDFFQNRCLGTIFYLGELLSKVFVFGFYIPVGEFFKEKAIEIRDSEHRIVLHLDRSQSEEFNEVFNPEIGEYEQIDPDIDLRVSQEPKLRSLDTPVEPAEPFEGGKILRGSEFFQTRCLGIIFYLGELLSKVFLFGFYIPVGDQFKEKAIQIREAEERTIVCMDRGSLKEIDDEIIDLTDDLRVSESSSKDIDPVLHRLIPEINQKVDEIHQRYRQNKTDTEDLANTVIDLVMILENESYSLKEEEIIQQTKPVFYLFVSKLAEKIDIEQELKTAQTKRLKLFLTSIQKKKILNNI